MDFIHETIQPHFNFWVYVILMMIGLWALIAKNNLIKKLMGLAIFQTAIILLYVSLGVKEGATIPILDHHAEEHETVELPDYAEHGVDLAPEHKVAPEHGDHHAEADAVADAVANPLPHVLMLTAIVVGVATLGVAMSIAQMVFKEFGSLEEDEVLEQIKSGNTDD